MNPFSKKNLKADNALGEPINPYPPEEEGKQEISIYHPSYEFLVKLIKLLSKTIPESIPEIKQISQSSPFKTVDDIGDLTTKIWTLATTKYNVPREWLISKLPEKKGSLNKKADMGKFWIYPDGDYEQINEDSEHQDWLQEVEGLDIFQAFDKGWIRASVDRNLGSYQLKDFNNIPESLDNFIVSHPSKEIEIADRNGYKYIKINYEDAISKGVQKAVKRSLVYASKKADLWPAQEETENMLTQSPGAIAYNNPKDTTVCGPNPNDVDKESKKKLNINKVIKILEGQKPGVAHIDFTDNSIELIDGTKLTFEEATKKALEIDKTADVSCCPKCRSKNIGEYNG